MDRIGSVRSAVLRTAGIAALALFVMARPALAQTAAPAQEQDLLKFTAPGTVLILFQIKADKTADFESGWSSMRSGFDKVTEADPKAFGATLSGLFKLDQPPIDVGGQKGVVYVLRIDNVSTAFSYNPVKIVYEMLWQNGKEGAPMKREEADVIYKKFQDSFLNITPWKLNKIG